MTAADPPTAASFVLVVDKLFDENVLVVGLADATDAEVLI
jgi:hypothetical protein